MKKPENYLAELRQSDRIFRLDRDTILVYTGREERDARPFLRVGAGQSMPPELLKYIENVILSEQEIANAGMELQWMKATLGSGGESVRYVGSKERVSQMYAYAGLAEMDEEDRPPVKVAPYGPFNSRVETKNKCMIMFMATGNFQITLNSSKLLDYFSYRHQKLNIDREYELITRALHRKERKAEKGTGFIYPGGTLSDKLSLYWFFNRAGLYLHPPENHHYDLVENSIDPENLKMAMSDSIHAPGFVEFVRRKAIGNTVAGAYLHDMEHAPLLKRIYNQMRWKFFDDGRPLPMADHAVFFKSKTGSHGIFSLKMHEHAEEHVEIMFPLAPVKQSKSFDFTRGPFDLEFQKIDTKEDLTAGALLGRLVLHAPGRIAPDVYAKGKLRDTMYPIVPGAEYLFHSPEKPVGGMDPILHALEGTSQKELFNQIVVSVLGGGQKNEDTQSEITKALSAWAKMPVPQDLFERQNAHEALRYLEWLHTARLGLDASAVKVVRSILAKHSMSRITNSQWMGMRGVRFNLVFCGGKLTLQLCERVQMDPIRIRLPRTIEEIAADPKSYGAYLRQQTRALDKSDEPPGLRQVLEFAEKVYEDRLHVVDDRKRLHLLKENLGIKPQVSKKPVSMLDRILSRLGLKKLAA